MKKKFIAVLLSSVLTAMPFTCVNAQPIEVEFSDASMDLSLNPYLQNGVLMVPLRAISEKFNFIVTWNGAEQAVNLLKVNTEAKVTVNSDICTINDNEIKLPAKVEIMDGSVYCPLAFIKEITQLQFAWDYNEKTLTVLASASQFNAFSFANTNTKKRVVIKNPLDPSKFASVEAAYTYACYPTSEEVFVTENGIVQECKQGGTGEWAYAKYDTKELKSVLSQVKSQCEIRFWAKTTSEEGNTVTVAVKSGGPSITNNFNIDNEWKEYSVVLNWNPQIDIQAAYALIGMRRYTAGEKVYIDGLSINPAE